MLIKMSITKEMILQMQNARGASSIWTWLQEMHETSDKGRAFYLKNMFLVQMEEV